MWGTHRVAGSGYGGLFRVFFDVSDDGGQSSKRKGPERMSNNNSTLVDAADGSNWVVVSGQQLWRTDIGGITWQRLSDPAGPAAIKSMAFPTHDIGWITSGSGRSCGRPMAGSRGPTSPTAPLRKRPQRTRRRRTAPGTAQSIPMAFVSAREGWLCSDPLLYTNDGGTDWHRVSSFDASASSRRRTNQSLLEQPGGDSVGSHRHCGPESVPQITHLGPRRIRRRDDPLAFPRLPDATGVSSSRSPTPTVITAGRSASRPRAEYPSFSTARPTADVPGRPWTTRRPDSTSRAQAMAGVPRRHTTDGGRTWEFADAPTPDHPLGVFAGLGDTVVTPDAIVVSRRYLGRQHRFPVLQHQRRRPHVDDAYWPATARDRRYDRSPGLRRTRRYHWQFAASNASVRHRGPGRQTGRQVSGLRWSTEHLIDRVPHARCRLRLGARQRGQQPSCSARPTAKNSVDRRRTRTPRDLRAPSHPSPAGSSAARRGRSRSSRPRMRSAQAALAYVKVPEHLRFGGVPGQRRARRLRPGLQLQRRIMRARTWPTTPGSSYVPRCTQRRRRTAAPPELHSSLAHYADGWHVFGHYP